MSRGRAGWRLLLILPAAASLLVGLNSALLLLGVAAPVAVDHFASAHGLAMVFGFVGALVALERSVALGSWWGYAAPILLAAGGLSQVAPVVHEATGILLVAGMAAMLGVYVPLWKRQRAEAVAIQMLGAVAGLAAAVLWLAGVETFNLIGWLATFLICTIAGERVELARIQISDKAQNQAVLLCFALVAMNTTATLFSQTGTVLYGLVLALLVLWLVLNDVARRTIKLSGAPRFMAACLLAGYFWLAVAAVIWMLGVPDSTARYDSVIHAVFLGFVMSMIMAHAPTILPAVLSIKLPYRAGMWVPAVLMHLALLLRIWLGNGLGHQGLWQIGGVLNVLALVLFLLTALGSAVLAGAERRTAALQDVQGKEKGQ